MGFNPAVEGRILYVTLHSKSNFTSITKLSILRWGNYPGLFSQPNGITKVLIRGRQEGQGHTKTM